MKIKTIAIHHVLSEQQITNLIIKALLTKAMSLRRYDFLVHKLMPLYDTLQFERSVKTVIQIRLGSLEIRKGILGLLERRKENHS